MIPRCFYFGCWNQAGHFLWLPGATEWGASARADQVEYYGKGAGRTHLDSTLAPRVLRPNTRTWVAFPNAKIVWMGMGKTQEERQRIHYDSEECPQGQFLLHKLDTGFTAIQWWDRNQGDRRGACNGTVLLEGNHTAAEMLAALEHYFPPILANLTKAGVALVEVTP